LPLQQSLPYGAAGASLNAHTQEQREVLYFFGGFCGTKYFSTLWRLDRSSNQSSFEPVLVLDASWARGDHAAAILSNKDNEPELVIFGGSNPSVRHE
jgi:hypothetical protein